jgi:hypothetical protein
LGSGHGGLSQLTVVGGLQFCRWEVADLAVQPAVVEPVDPGESGQLDLDTLSTELLAVVDQTMEPTRVSVWLRPFPPGSSGTAGSEARPTPWAY